MIETKPTNDSEEVEMTETAFISPSSSPGQPSGVVLLPRLPSSAHPAPHPHLSPPPTPSGSPGEEDSPPSSFPGVRLGSDEDPTALARTLHHVLYRHPRQTYSGCYSIYGQQRLCRSFSRGSVSDRDPEDGDDLARIAPTHTFHADDVSHHSDDVSPPSDDVSDEEEVIDVIGDDDDGDDDGKTVAMETSDVRRDGSDLGRDVVCEDDCGNGDGGIVDADTERSQAKKNELETSRQDEKSNAEEEEKIDRQESSPTAVTNFSIAAILKPDFGPARKLRLESNRYHVNDSNTNHNHNSARHSLITSQLNHQHHHHPNFIKPLFNLHTQYFQLQRQQHQKSQPHHHHHHHHHRLHHQQQQQPPPPPPPATSLHQEQKTRTQAHQFLHYQPHHPRLSPAAIANNSATTTPSPVDLSTRGRSHRRSDVRDRSSPDMTSSKRTGTAGGVNRKAECKSGGGGGEKEKKSSSSSTASSNKNSSSGGGDQVDANKHLWPAWVFCTRYSDRPSSGPRSRRVKRKRSPTSTTQAAEEKRPRTAFSSEQLARLKREFDDCRYLTETRRRHLAAELGLTESQIKIWFQNKRAKIKKSSGVKNELALQLMAQGLYNHSTVTVEDDSDDVTVC